MVFTMMWAMRCLKGLRPLPPTLADSPLFEFYFIFGKCFFFSIFGWDLVSESVWNRWEMAVGFKWMDSRFISSHIDLFSTVLYDFYNFGIVFGGLTLLPEGPRTFWGCPEAA